MSHDNSPVSTASTSVASSLTRRSLVASALTGVGMAMAQSVLPKTASAADPVVAEPGTVVKKGNLKQSTCAWCYKMPLDQLAAAGKAMGLVGIDLVKPEQFPILKQFGLVSTMTTMTALDKGLCDPQYHDDNIEKLKVAIEATSAEGWKNVICFSGNARGIDRETGLKNCVTALEKLLPFAQEKKVVLQMELLNSKVNHPDYMCDNTTWGIELCKMVKSENFKLLYDIYHMQIMEGDIIRTIKKDIQYFGHFHTAGNPGRHELDDKQELNYKAIAEAVQSTGYQGYFVHEFIATRDPLISLAEAVALCDV
jgi:hydroxypyruvate isomerase